MNARSLNLAIAPEYPPRRAAWRCRQRTHGSGRAPLGSTASPESSSYTAFGTRNSVQPIWRTPGRYFGDSGSSDGYVDRFQNAMLRAVVPNAWAMVFRLSPDLTMTTRNVGAGVGVGGTNEGVGVGPVGGGAEGLAVGTRTAPLPGAPLPRDPVGRHPTSAIVAIVSATAASPAGTRSAWRRPFPIGVIDCIVRWTAGSGDPLRR